MAICLPFSSSPADCVQSLEIRAGGPCASQLRVPHLNVRGTHQCPSTSNEGYAASTVLPQKYCYTCCLFQTSCYLCQSSQRAAKFQLPHASSETIEDFPSAWKLWQLSKYEQGKGRNGEDEYDAGGLDKTAAVSTKVWGEKVDHQEPATG